MIKVLRTSRCWTQETLSLVSGVSVRTIQRIEAGDTPSAETLLALAAAFNLTPQDVGGHVGVVHVQEWAQTVVFPNDGARLQYWETPTKLVDYGLKPAGPFDVKRFRIEFPQGERPTLIVERVTARNADSAGSNSGALSPHRTICPCFCEADLSEGETLETRLRDVVAAFRAYGCDGFQPGTSIEQITWVTLMVVGETPLHSMLVTPYTFGAPNLRFIASLNVIPHTTQPTM